MPRRREIEVFSLSFLDAICCGFGAVIMLLVLNKAGEPRIIEKAKINRQELVAALQRELAEIRGETDVMVREKMTVDERSLRDQQLLASLQGELSRIRGEFAASSALQIDSDLEGQLSAAKQRLGEEMRALLASYTPPKNDTTVAGITPDSEYVVFVIDSSGSMKSQWPLVVRKVTETLESYPKIRGIQIMNGEGTYLLPGYSKQWIPDSPGRRRELVGALSNWNAADYSYLLKGIRKAIVDFYQPGRRMSIFVFGDDVAASGSAESLVREVERVNGSVESDDWLVRVHGVGFNTGMARDPRKFANLMRAMSARNGGTFVALTEKGPNQPRVIIQGPGFPR